MTRRARFPRILTTCHFSPHQLQPHTVLGWAMDAMHVAVAHQLRPLRTLVRDHRWSLVIVGFEATWRRPLGFLDADAVEIETGLRLHDGRRELIGFETRIMADRDLVVEIRSTGHPVRVSGSAAMDAEPCGVPEDLRALLPPDEITTAPLPRLALPAGAPIRSGSLPFQLRRDECETADQWANATLATLAGRAREQLAFAGLPEGLSLPVRDLRAALRRPIFFGEEGVIDTDVFRLPEGLVFAHRIRSRSRGGDEDRARCATVVETLAPWDAATAAA